MASSEHQRHKIFSKQHLANLTTAWCITINPAKLTTACNYKVTEKAVSILSTAVWVYEVLHMFDAQHK